MDGAWAAGLFASLTVAAMTGVLFTQAITRVDDEMSSPILVLFNGDEEDEEE